MGAGPNFIPPTLYEKPQAEKRVRLSLPKESLGHSKKHNAKPHNGNISIAQVM